jgi:hypothetical protein
MAGKRAFLTISLLSYTNTLNIELEKIGKRLYTYINLFPLPLLYCPYIPRPTPTIPPTYLVPVPLPLSDLDNP